MKTIWIIFAFSASAISALPAERWPNVGPNQHEIVKHEVVVITPTSEYTPHQYVYEVTPAPAPKQEVKYSYAIVEDNPSYDRPSKKKYNYDEASLRKYYNHLVDSKVAKKKHALQKIADKTIGVTAKLAQYTVDFLSRVAISTAANLAKNGASHAIHKKVKKYNHGDDNDHHEVYYGKKHFKYFPH